jgi:mono/diheme cytochrome c family protein
MLFVRFKMRSPDKAEQVPTLQEVIAPSRALTTTPTVEPTRGRLRIGRTARGHTTTVLLAAAALLPACGGNGGSQLTAQEAQGREIFLTVGCADCHTLADAGATGHIGGDLDWWPRDRGRLESVVYNGSSFASGMPSFREELTADEIEAVVAYVMTVGSSKAP